MKQLIYILILFPMVVFAQEKAASHKINFGLFITPELNSLFFHNSPGQGQGKAEQKFGYSAGLNLEMQLTKKITVRTGVGYGYKNYKYVVDKLYFATDIDPKIGFISESSMETKGYYSEIQVPLVIQFDIKENKFFIAGGIEIYYPFEFKYERTIYFGNGDIDSYYSDSYHDKNNFAPELSFGYKIPLSDKLSLSLEPIFKYYLKDNIYPDSHLFNYGIKVTFNLGH